MGIFTKKPPPKIVKFRDVEEPLDINSVTRTDTYAHPETRIEGSANLFQVYELLEGLKEMPRYRWEARLTVTQFKWFIKACEKEFNVHLENPWTE